MKRDEENDVIKLNKQTKKELYRFVFLKLLVPGADKIKVFFVKFYAQRRRLLLKDKKMCVQDTGSIKTSNVTLL